MPFDQSSIIEVRPPTWDGSTLQLSWTSTAPAGTTFQVYVGRKLAWYGTSRWVALTMPTSRVRFDIGAVGSGEATVDFSPSLPHGPSDRVTLSWLGGSFLDPTGGDDVQGFRIFGPRKAGWAVDFSTPLVEISAYPGGVPIDGYGITGFGQGGFGRAASFYQWTSPALATGSWTFAVVPYDAAGNQGAPALQTAWIASPPRPPAAKPDGSRLRCDFDPTTRRATLTWNPSPA
ncbi:hypothetical protein [Paludisphaera mucosa]|uniref:Uncharacterized protein n=1 Tax=Paludisphaera mucosa TaxID=3030827 RepID=A0ABT6FD47_9BACT|nr:hypothetical protein [Paludisphaera mucosa]MDG3005496.1 hypothetical protein [Paludisphaera mucosa]